MEHCTASPTPGVVSEKEDQSEVRQAVSGLADLHGLEGELQEIRFLASLENQIKGYSSSS